MDSSKKTSLLSDLALLFVAAVWGGGFVVVKDALDILTPMYLMSIRFILASAALYLFLHRKIGKINVCELKRGSVVGLLLFLAFAAQTVGLQYTTASKQGFLTATYVVMVPIIHFFIYKKVPSKTVVASSLLSIVGIGLISLNSTLAINVGDLLTLICAFFFASHIISIEYFAKNMDVFKLAFLQIAVAAILFTVSALILEPMPTVITTKGWLLLAYMAVFATFLCFTVQTVAQKYTTSSHASIILSLESVFAAVFGVLLLSEDMTPSMILGSCIIFVAILLIEGDFSSIMLKKNEVKKKHFL
ncbi:MAG: DMT family transporter [Acidaminobacteraceae bacterium]